jgi:hypothetical protein
MEDTMRPTTAFDDNVFDFNALLHPGTIFDHPRDVLAHPSLSVSEKRAILASWASDASAIASCPALRAPAGLKAPVTIDEILEALCELDGGPRHPPGRQTEPIAFNVEGHGGVGRNTMDEIRLPRHIVNRFERRWTARIPQMVGDWQRLEPTPSSLACGCYDPLRSPQVRRLLQGSLRPPTAARTRS